MEVTYRAIGELRPWDSNPRDIKQDDLERLKNQLQLLGQYKPLLVTPEGTVLGGNMRYRALMELGVDRVWVSTVDFRQDTETQLWKAVVNGEEQVNRFTTKEQALMEYALSDNDRAGFYRTDMLGDITGNLDIDWTQYAVDLEPPMTIDEVMKSIAPEPSEDPNMVYQVVVTCASPDDQSSLITEMASTGRQVKAKTMAAKKRQQ